MMKNCLLAVALLSLAFAVGCAKGGNGVVPTVSVSSNPISNDAIYPTQSVPLTATVKGTGDMSVTWSVTGGGTLTNIAALTATYVAPAAATSGITVIATLSSDSMITFNLPITVVDITTQVTPSTPNVGTNPNLVQQFAATALPDDAPQTFNWTCTASGVPCANFVQDSKISGLAYYTAQDTCTGSCVQISAITPLDPNGCTANPKFCSIAKISLVTSRVSGIYAFRFSGYDSSNNATAAVGTFTAANGSITSGLEDELASNVWTQHSITGGSYTPTSVDPNNSNNAGTLTLTGASPDKFQVVLDSAGDIEMIESDGHGTGSGVAQISGGTQPFKGDQTYAFGFTGVDATGNRIGYVGLFPMDGNGNIVSGQMDVNDNGSSSNGVCGAPPCTVTGTYASNGNGSYKLTLTAPIAMKFDFYIGPGSNSKSTPLTMYAVSTDPGTNPAVSGTMVLQDNTQTYNTGAFDGTSVSALTGVNGANTNVSLTLGTTNGGGAFTGAFDQNNAGNILTVPASASANEFSYTYGASGTQGRYTFQMLGNPGASPVVQPLPFILYASGANRGFLLDQSSSSVMTGTMNPQGKVIVAFDNSELPGTFGAATTSSGTSTVSPIAANLVLTVLTPQGSAETFNVSGTEYPGTLPVSGAFDLAVAARVNGTGTITLTSPAQTYAIYPLDTAGCSGNNPVCVIEDFYMIDETPSPNVNKNPSVIFAKE